MELQFKHIAPYLFYELLGKINDADSTIAIEVESSNFHFTWSMEMFFRDMSPVKPQLRPLSQIQSYFEPLFEIDEEVRDFLAQEYLEIFGIHSVEEIKNVDTNYLPVGTYNLLLKHHFDLFELIENGLATIKE